MEVLSILKVLSIITAFQLLMLCLVLVSKRNSQKTNYHILTLFIFSNALLFIQYLVTLYGFINLPDISIFYYLLGPLMYLYVQSLCVKKFKFNKTHSLHFLIFFLAICYLIFNVFFIENLQDTNWEYYESLVIQVVLHLQIACYIIASFISIFKYRSEIKNLYAAIEQINLSWLLVIIFAFSTMWFTDFIAFLFIYLFDNYSGASIYLVITSVSINLIFVNYLVYKGMRQTDAFDGLKTQKKYSGSKLSKNESVTLADQLTSVMSAKKLYLNPDLTIKDLSEELEIHQKQLSQVINSQFDKNFYDFVNHFRIQEAKEIMIDKSKDKMTILEILYTTGFNSKSAFNNAFKKNTGQTPTEFKKSA